MRRVPLLVAALLLLSLTVIAAGTSTTWPSPPPVPQSARRDAAATPRHTESFLDSHVLVTWYGNPWSERMGILGRLEDKALADGLKKQAGGGGAGPHKKGIPAHQLGRPL